MTAPPTASSPEPPDPVPDRRADGHVAAASPSPGPKPDVPEAAVRVAVDIEHEPLPDGDDPRLWSDARKWAIVAMLSAGSWIPATSANIIFPALSSIEAGQWLCERP